jgi:UrcA family protein
MHGALYASQPAGPNLPEETAESSNDLPNIQETTMKTLITTTYLPRLIKTAIIGALALSWGAASLAAGDSEVPKVVVKFGDLNLSNPQGAAKLYGRIAAAGNAVCKPFDINSRALGSRARLDACVHKAIADAVTKVNQPELFAIYNAKNHQSRPILVAAAARTP